MRVALVAIPLALVACAGESPSRATPIATIAPPSASVIRDNIADTSVTGIAEIVGASRTGQPTGASGYVNNHYDLKVLKWLSGKGSEKQVLSQGAETSIKPYAPGTILFFSACMAKDGEISEPDVGYVFPIDSACRAEIEKMGEAAAKRATALGKRKKACTKTK
jgi:hypothetical protein